MIIQITDVTDLKHTQRGVSSKIHAGNETYYVDQDASNLIGKKVDISFEEKTSQKGNKYKIAKILSVVGDQADGNGAGHGNVEWSEYAKVAREAHKLALELEPDSTEILPNGEGTTETIKVDRSNARIRFVNTALMALKDGKLWLDDDIPF